VTTLLLKMEENLALDQQSGTELILANVTEDGARGVFMVPVLHHAVLAHKPEHVYAITQHQLMEGQGASVQRNK